MVEKWLGRARVGTTRIEDQRKARRDDSADFSARR
jgi:hypothetical protein